MPRAIPRLGFPSHPPCSGTSLCGLSEQVMPDSTGRLRIFDRCCDGGSCQDDPLPASACGSGGAQDTELLLRWGDAE